MRKTIKLTVEQPRTAVDALHEASGLPKQRIKDAMAKGACWWWVKGKQLRLRRATRELAGGTRLALWYDDQVLARTPDQPILLQDHGRYSVWFKPHGLLAQGSQWGDHCSLLRLAELQLKRPCHLIHRLDADAAGLMLTAHDPKAAGALSALFAGRTMTKIYQAWVEGQPDLHEQLIDTPIDGKAARSVATTLRLDPQLQRSLLQVRIETGRKHQIRRHLAGIGHPITGDPLYGKPEPKTPLQLVAVNLAFQCPFTRKAMNIHLPEAHQL